MPPAVRSESYRKRPEGLPYAGSLSSVGLSCPNPLLVHSVNGAEIYRLGLASQQRCLLTACRHSSIPCIPRGNGKVWAGWPRSEQALPCPSFVHHWGNRGGHPHLWLGNSAFAFSGPRQVSKITSSARISTAQTITRVTSSPPSAITATSLCLLPS
jgi:hypothetical protein